MNKHVEAAKKYPASAQGYEAEGASPEDLTALKVAGHVLKEDGKWYAAGYGPVRGGWGCLGNNGVGYGPVYRG